MLLTKELLHTTATHIKKLNQSGFKTVEDLINHYPRTYENKSNVLDSFSFVNIKEKNAIKVTLETIKEERTRNGKMLIKAVIRDANNFFAEAVWFNQTYLMRQFRIGDTVLLFGKPKYEYGKLSFVGPQIESFSDKSQSIAPVYPAVAYIPTTWFAQKMPLLLPYFKSIPDVLPPEIIAKKGFRSKKENLLKIHFPQSVSEFEEARAELAYEELFMLQYQGIQKKKTNERESEGKSKEIPMNIELIKEIIDSLPFALTDKQKIVTFQILKDMERKFAMNRLLQGDVWTGKTVVALITAIHAIKEAGIQVAFMAPTEILARQHGISLERFLVQFGIKFDILVGSLTKKQKDEVKARLKTGETDLVIGTHALIQEDVHFRNLAYVIIDEQHRFGVEQRKVLEQYYSLMGKVFPHNLNMTATPIPRTLALTIYGDQDISILNEYPAGRKPIHTKVINESDREQVFRFIEEEVKSGRQVYWISPLVTESETLDIANAVNTQETLRAIFPKFNIGLLHGKMKPKEKDEVMREFIENKVHILSSTSVVEVGVNNPNATIICIEAAERFWLSQLHQFRGRVWRGEDQSYCYLFTTKEYKDQRLRAMEKTNDGFELAEVDLELRGPGEVYGVRQSGVPEFKIADLRDIELISEIREDIETMLA